VLLVQVLDGIEQECTLVVSDLDRAGYFGSPSPHGRLVAAHPEDQFVPLTFRTDAYRLEDAVFFDGHG
jgi:hypothetical protein